MSSVPETVAEIRSEWMVAVDSHGVSTTAAGRVALADFLKAFNDRAVSPIEFAEAVWWLARRVPEFEPILQTFIGLASEWQDDMRHRSEYDEDIRTAATGLRLPIY